MQITADLRLVLPVRWSPELDAQGKPVALVSAYHIPISREVFEANYRVLAAVKDAIFSKGIAYSAEVGPQIARLAFMDAARMDAIEHGVAADGPAFLGELRRLTTVIAPGEGGYTPLPVDVAVANGTIDGDDWAEAESALVFFTSAYSLAIRARREAVARSLASVLMGSTTSSPLTEYVASLPTSTPAATSEAAASSVPS